MIGASMMMYDRNKHASCDMYNQDEIEKLNQFALKNKSLFKKDVINHVKSNIKLTGKINKIRDIQLFCRNFVQNKNSENIKTFKEEVDIVQR